MVYGDARDPELWENINLENVKAIMLAIPNPDTKVEATKLLRQYGYKGDVVALTMRSNEHRALRDAGATAVCLPMSQAGKKLAELSLEEGPSESTSLNLTFDR